MISNRIGFQFALPIVAVGLLITLFGIISLIQVTIFGFVLIPVGLLFVTSSYGSEIDPVKNQFREYDSYLGVKRGDWTSMDDVFFLTVLKGRLGTRFYSQSNRSTSLIDDKYEVYFLNKNHRKKVLIQKFETKKEAIEFAEKISKIIKKQIVSYNPVVSEKTRLRRRSS